MRHMKGEKMEVTGRTQMWEIREMEEPSDSKAWWLKDAMLSKQGFQEKKAVEEKAPVTC